MEYKYYIKSTTRISWISPSSIIRSIQIEAPTSSPSHLHVIALGFQEQQVLFGLLMAIHGLTARIQ